MRHLTVAMLAGVLAFAAGCGGESVDDSDGGGSEPTTEEAKRPPKPKEEVAGLGAVTDCLEDLGFKVDRYDKNGIRVTDPSGDPQADIDIHPSVKEAQRFYRQLEVEGAQGGRFTVTYFYGRDTGESERAVIGDCIREAS